MTNSKPGYKTTEFWLTAITGLVAIVNQSGAFHFQIPVETVTQVVTVVGAYVGSRSVLKAVQAYAGTKVKPLDAAKLNN